MPGDIDADDVNEFVASCYPQLGVRCLDIGEDFVTAEYDLSEIERRPGGLHIRPRPISISRRRSLVFDFCCDWAPR